MRVCVLKKWLNLCDKWRQKDSVIRWSEVDNLTCPWEKTNWQRKVRFHDWDWKKSRKKDPRWKTFWTSVCVVVVVGNVVVVVWAGVWEEWRFAREPRSNRHLKIILGWKMRRKIVKNDFWLSAASLVSGLSAIFAHKAREKKASIQGATVTKSDQELNGPTDY